MTTPRIATRLIKREAMTPHPWQEDLITLAQATVRIATTLERLLALVEESRAEEMAQARRKGQHD